MSDFQYDGEMSEEMAAQPSRKPKVEVVFDSDLAAGLGFTMDDLVANHEGVMTERQKNTLKQRAGKKGRVYGGLYFLWAAVTMVAVVSSLPTTQKLGVSLMGFMFSAGVAALYRGWAYPLVNDALDRLVAECSGRTFREANASGTRFTLTVGSTTFTVEREAYLCLKNVASYTVYYAPRSKVVLSAEPMEAM